MTGLPKTDSPRELSTGTGGEPETVKGSPNHPVRLTRNEWLNAFSIATVFALIPQAPFRENLWLTLSLWCFGGTAVLNHLFPERLRNLTHGVKAAYTILLYASIGAPLLIPVLIIPFDLAPWFLPARHPGRKVSEFLGFVGRSVALGIGFFHIFGNQPMEISLPFLLLFAGLNYVYYRERKSRLQADRRFLYGWAHSCEHLAVWLYLFLLNLSALNLPATWTSLALLAALAFAGLFFVPGKPSRHPTVSPDR